MNFLQIRVSGMGESYAQRSEIAVCRLVQGSEEKEYEELEELLVWLVGLLQRTDSQDYLILVSRDFNDESFICGCAIARQVFKGFGDRRRRPLVR